MERGQDIVLGALFAAIGLGAAWMASAHSGATGGYPMALGLSLAVCGVLVALRGIRSIGSARRILIGQPAQFIRALIACVLYVALIVPLGFYTASFVLMLALPFALGFLRPVYTGIVAVCFIFMVWVVFTAVLEKPLPAELWSVSRMGGN